MKHLVKYKSRFDGKNRSEILPTLNDLLVFLGKVNDLTDERDSVQIQSVKIRR